MAEASHATAALPPRFAHLDRFVEGWAQPSEKARFVKLHSSSFEELKDFYDAVLPEMDAILTHLKQHPVDALPDSERTLFHLAMTFAETAHPLDLGWKDTDFPEAYPWHRFEFRSVSLEP